MRNIVLLVVALQPLGSLHAQIFVPAQQIPNNPNKVDVREQSAVIHSLNRRHAEAVAEWTRVIELDNKRTYAYQQRGFNHFSAGMFNESIADFDEVIRRDAKSKNGHWARGISCYYAGRYGDGRRQFARCLKAYSHDVESAMWQFICVARAHGIDQARQATLKLGNDRLNERRELMKRVCDLYNGILKPADVVAAANAGKVDAQQRNIQLFYAHLYVGIYYDLTGDKNLAFEHVNAATGDEHRWHGQLWDIARVQRNVLAKDLKKIDALIARARLLESMDKFDEAVAEWSKVIELQLDKDSADSYQFRGLVRFKAGQIKESIADFDEYIKRVPKAKISHWQRGISYYYAAEYENGRKQFEGYQDFDSNDVENAVWRFMCMVRADGIDKARKTILKIGDDRRVPMRQVYDLYKGDLKPDDVLAAANAGKVGPSQRNSQLFYAHLYVGIYYDLVNDKKKAFDHVNKAAEEHRIGHYMWDVARIHRDMLSKELKKNRD